MRIRGASFIVVLILASPHSAWAQAGARPAAAEAPARSAVSPANTFDVRSYGAKSDGQTDSTASIQRAVNAAQAAAEVDLYGSATVFIPSGRKPYLVSSPIFVDGRGIEVRGEGMGSQVRPLGNYGGPAFVLGVKRLNRSKIDAWRFRKDSRAVLDVSTRSATENRYALATRGEASVVFEGHPFQYGGQSPTYKGIVPDYWTETRQLTLEFCVARPSGVTWPTHCGLIGSFSRFEPQPWFLVTGDIEDELIFSFKTEDQPTGNVHQVNLPAPISRGPCRVTIQLDLEAGGFAAWINGKRVTPKIWVIGPQPAEGFRPGLRLKRHDGVSPFVIGSAYGGIGIDHLVTNVELYGLRISRGLVYEMDGPTEKLMAMRWPIDDAHRYFEFIANDRVQTIALLPLNEPAGTVVKAVSLGYDGCGYWIPSKRVRTSANLALRDLQVWSGLQQAIAVGEIFGLKIENVHAGHGLQGIGSVSLGITYPVTLRGCSLYGHDAAYFGYQQILYASENVLGLTGRQGIRICGGTTSWDRTMATFMSGHTESFMHFVVAEAGQIHRVTDMLVDNEAGDIKRAIIECEQGANCPTRLVVDGLDVSRLNEEAALIRLTGFGIDAAHRKARLEVRNLTIFLGESKVALRVDGQGWYGTFDASSLGVANVAGDGAGKITVIPPVIVP